MKKSVLVLGGNGYIAKYLVLKLAKEQKVKVFIHGGIPGIFLENPNIRIFRGSALDRSCLKGVLQKGDTVINFVGTTSGEKNIQRHIELNVTAQSNILEECVKQKAGKILFLSTLHVYAPSPYAHKERDAVLASDDYSLTKILGEEMYRYYNFRYGLPAIVLRLGSVYGPFQEKGVFYSFASTIKRSREIYIPQGGAWRDFIFIADVVSAIQRALGFKTGKCECFNVSSAEKVNLGSVARLAKKMLMIPVLVRTVGERPKLRVSLGSNMKARRLLHFMPTTGLEEGLAETFASYELPLKGGTMNKKVKTF